MRRYHLFELNDEAWCPASLRDSVTDLLGFVLNTGNHYRSIVPELKRGLDETRSHAIIDLCSGGGGPWLSLSRELERNGIAAEIVLTDRFPNLKAFEALSKSAPGVRFSTDPVDVMGVPPSLTGFRTLFTAFHHFREDMAQAILADAVRNRAGIGIFEFTYRMSWPVFIAGFLPAVAGTILLVLLATPFVRPFRWSRLLWTYVLPLLPLGAVWDGFVSCLRTYTPGEMLAMANSAGGDGYKWVAGTVRTRASLMPVSYLVGVPKPQLAGDAANGASAPPA